MPWQNVPEQVLPISTSFHTRVNVGGPLGAAMPAPPFAPPVPAGAPPVPSDALASAPLAQPINSHTTAIHHGATTNLGITTPRACRACGLGCKRTWL
jgi:hypothetical protein